jgi:glycosyltransferase involved in cell wall biosynthesis
MNNETQKKLDNLALSIEKIKAKENKIYFFVQDTKGNPKGSVGHVYQLVKILRSEGYDALLLHDDGYKPAEWLGREFAELPHQSIRANLMVAAHDMIVLPEILSYVMEQVASIPCIKVVLVQAYDWIFETLEAGASWLDYGFDRCITVSEGCKQYIQNFFPQVRIDVVPPFLSEEFHTPTLPQKPIIAIHSREQRDTLKIVKAFYLKYPHYRWIGFKDLRGVSRAEFAEGLKYAAVSVWVDPTASVGTFPLEAMKCGVPVIGKIPTRVPEWMSDDNGIWVADENDIIDQIARYLAYWLEDKVPQSLFEEMQKTITPYSEENTRSQLLSAIDFYVAKRCEALEDTIKKIKETESHELHNHSSLS